MKNRILPETALGKCSIYLAVIFIVLFILLIVLATAGQESGETFFSNLYLAIPGLVALVSGIAGFLTGIISIIFLKERAILVYVATAVGLLIIAFILSDMLITED